MPNPYSNQPNAKPPHFLLRLISFIFRTVLLVVVVYGLIIFGTDIRHEAAMSRMKQTITLPFKYTQLMQQEAPQPNSLPNPITNAHLTDTWGAARSGGRRHEGIDIFAERGTPIHSTTAGILRRVGTDSLGGNVVSIVGPGGVGHYYAHLEEFADISEGDWVETGDIIGYVGDSGNAKGTPPHVHYGVYLNSGAVNPYPLLIK